VEFKDLTIDQLREKRPDLLEGILKTKEDDEASQKQAEDLKEAQRKLDEYEVKEKLAEKREKVKGLIEEAKLPEELTSDVFMETLLKAKDEDEMKSLIEDRKKLTASKKPQSKGGGETQIAEGAELTKESFLEQIKS
jgi:preprotein translocase subunit SecD